MRIHLQNWRGMGQLITGRLQHPLSALFFTFALALAVPVPNTNAQASPAVGVEATHVKAEASAFTHPLATQIEFEAHTLGVVPKLGMAPSGSCPIAPPAKVPAINDSWQSDVDGTPVLHLNRDSRSSSCNQCLKVHQAVTRPPFAMAILLRADFKETPPNPSPLFVVERVSRTDFTSNPLPLGTALTVLPPVVPRPWQFQGNDGDGAKTWLSEAHVLQINPDWLNFSLFDSMDLNITEESPGPGLEEPQLWRSTFTAGLGTDWQFTRTLALHAGYRYFHNPIPDDVSAGAFPNANQHVMAMAMSLQDGPHTLALAYGLDILDAASPSGISSARHGDNIDPLAHLVAFTYSYSF